MYDIDMNEFEPNNNEQSDQEPGRIEEENIQTEIETIIRTVEGGRPFTPELLGRFQELNEQLIDNKPDTERVTAQFELSLSVADLKFTAGYINEAVEDLEELLYLVENAGDEYEHISELASDRIAQYRDRAETNE